MSQCFPPSPVSTTARLLSVVAKSTHWTCKATTTHRVQLTQVQSRHMTGWWPYWGRRSALPYTLCARNMESRQAQANGAAMWRFGGCAACTTFGIKPGAWSLNSAFPTTGLGQAATCSRTATSLTRRTLMARCVTIESLKYPTLFVPHPLGVPPPRWGARRGPERSGGLRRDPSLKIPPPTYFFPKKIGMT